jgi:hypothetical protein
MFLCCISSGFCAVRIVRVDKDMRIVYITHISYEPFLFSQRASGSTGRNHALRYSFWRRPRGNVYPRWLRPGPAA